MSSSHSATLASLVRHWNNHAAQASDDQQMVDMSARSQWYRFEMFARTHTLSGTRILDVGCGTGEFYNYLRSRSSDVDYLGVDLSSEMIARCNERFPGGGFEERDILGWETSQEFDFVTAFAIHNIRIPGAKELLWDLTRRQFELCTQAAHLSLLTDRFTGFSDDILPWNPAEILSMALEITPWVTLRHDYLPHDFSLTLYRTPLADRDPIAMPSTPERQP